MRKRYLVIALVLLLVGCSNTQKAVKKSSATNTDTQALLSYQKEINTDFLRQKLSVIADDSMEGRETAHPGQVKAANYLASQYKKMGITPAGDNGTYFQKFKLNANVSDSVVFETSSLEGGQPNLVERSVASANGTANYIKVFGGTKPLQGEIVFAGFGVNDPAHNVQHLEGMDMSGKWLMVFQDIPHVVEGDTIISASANTRSRFSAILRQSDAEGLLVIPSMSIAEFQDAAMQSQADYGKISGMRLAYLDKGQRRGGFSKGYDVINPALAAQLLGLDNAGALAQFREDLIQNITTFTPYSTGFSLKQTPYDSPKVLETENVVAKLEGADPLLKDQFVVLSAHYDHLGIGRPDSTGDTIYNGADDDGSGTVGVLNIAHAFAEAREHGIMPRRSILFLHVTGEEKGLLGSRYFSDHPVVPVTSMVANLNTDMIGRIDEEHEKEGVENYAYIIGSELISSQIDSVLKVANSQSGRIQLDKTYNDFNDPNQFYRRSDHWNFGRLGIPFIFFFTGVHKDYHRPSDEIDKILFPKMARITRTIYATAVLIANGDKAPAVDNQAFINITKGGS